MIIETIHVDFDELTSMASEQFSSGPGPKLLTPRTISSGLMLNIPSLTLYIPPAKNKWEILFQPMFEVYLNSPPRVDPQVLAVIAPERAVSTGTPSSMTIDQDAPSTKADHDIEVAHMDNNPFVKFPIPKPSSEESSTQVVILNHVHSINQPPKHINKWTKDHPIDNVIGNPSKPVSTRQQLQDEALLCYFDAFLSSVESKSYKDELTESCWIEAMQEELNEFERLKLWELVPRPDCVIVITLKWIYKGETLYEYYWRFSHLINDMHNIRMTMQQVQVNTKFLNALPSEWSKFITDVKLAKSLYTTNYDQLKEKIRLNALTKQCHFCLSSNPRNQATIQDGRVTTKDLDAYESDCDDLSPAKAVLMANLSSYDSNVLSEESQDVVIQDTNSSAPNDLLVLFLVEQMTDYVAHLDKENQTNKMVNESLTAELEKYKERVAIFEQRLNVDLNKRRSKCCTRMLNEWVNFAMARMARQGEDGELAVLKRGLWRVWYEDSGGVLIEIAVRIEDGLKMLTQSNNWKRQMWGMARQSYDERKDTVIRRLKDRIKSLSGKDNVENVKKDIDEIEIINIELEHSVAQFLSENGNLRKEREQLKSIYKDEFDLIRKTRVQSKEHCDSLIAQRKFCAKDTDTLFNPISWFGSRTKPWVRTAKRELKLATHEAIIILSGFLFGRTLSVLATTTLPTSMAARRPQKFYLRCVEFASPYKTGCILQQQKVTHIYLYDADVDILKALLKTKEQYDPHSPVLSSGTTVKSTSKPQRNIKWIFFSSDSRRRCLWTIRARNSRNVKHPKWGAAEYGVRGVGVVTSRSTAQAI
ncbi:retrovirus-related pol polyprotein from transposon TNT 1-94 [Tanacetum coccineum]